VAGWLDRVRHWLSEIGERDFTLPDLGAQLDPPEAHAAVLRLAARLDQALPEEFLDRVRARLAREEHVSDVHWRNLLFELKRYFLLAALLRSAPMWSAAVDEIWHAMILHTREYEAFCRSFLDGFLHHAPNPSPQPDPQGRAFFDLAYVTLFVATPFSQRVWGPFLRHPLDADLARRCRESPDGVVAERFSPRCASDADLGLLARRVVGGVAEAADAVRDQVGAAGPGSAGPAAFQQAFAPAGGLAWADSGYLTRWMMFQTLFGPPMGFGVLPFGGFVPFGGGWSSGCTSGGCSGFGANCGGGPNCGSGAGCGGSGCGAGCGGGCGTGG
jgi:hypothetical protein